MISKEPPSETLKPQYKALSASEICELQNRCAELEKQNAELQKMLDITLDMLEYFRQQLNIRYFIKLKD